MSEQTEIDQITALDGIGSGTVDKFKDAGYRSFNDILFANPAEIEDDVSGVGEGKVEEVIEFAVNNSQGGGFTAGDDLIDSFSDTEYLQWLVPEVDDVLGGGTRTGDIMEVYGEFGSGKSQISHQLSVNVQLQKDNGGLHGRAVFIDTEDSFKPNRIAQMVRGLDEEILADELEERELDYTVEEVKDSEINIPQGLETPADYVAKDFIENIHYVSAKSVAHQKILIAQKLGEMAERYEDTDRPVRLAVVDSFTALFRSQYVGRGDLADRQQEMNQHIVALSQYCEDYNIAGLITNQVQSNPDAFFSDPIKPIGGNILGHNSDYRIYIKKRGNGTNRSAQVDDAPDLADEEGEFHIRTAGLKSS